MNKKIILIFLVVCVLLLARYVYLWKTENDEVVKRCPEYVKYEPELKAWYWQVPTEDGYFPTKEEALGNCVNFWEKQ